MAAYREKSLGLRFHIQTSNPAFQQHKDPQAKSRKGKADTADKSSTISKSKESAHAAVRIRTVAAAQTAALHRPVAWLCNGEHGGVPEHML